MNILSAYESEPFEQDSSYSEMMNASEPSRAGGVKRNGIVTNAPQDEGDEFPKIEQGTEDYYDLVFGLCQMFDEIDINGDGTMEWAELLQFLQDTVNLANKMNAD